MSINWIKDLGVSLGYPVCKSYGTSADTIESIPVVLRLSDTPRGFPFRPVTTRPDFVSEGLRSRLEEGNVPRPKVFVYMGKRGLGRKGLGSLFGWAVQ